MMVAFTCEKASGSHERLARWAGAVDSRLRGKYRCRRWFLVPAHFHGDDELDGLLEGGHHLLGEKTHAPLHGLFRQQAAGVEFGGETRQT